MSLSARTPRFSDFRRFHRGLGLAAGLRGASTLTLAVAALTACADRHDKVDLRESTNLAAAVSPDGERIVFTLLGQLWVVATDGGATTRLADSIYFARDPAWEQNGPRIAFITVEGSRHSLRLLNTKDGKVRTLVAGRRELAHPAWSPDGSQIVYAMGTPSDSDLWAISTDGSEPHQLTGNPGMERWPVWTGSGIVFVRGSNTTSASGGDPVPPPSDRDSNDQDAGDAGDIWILPPGGENPRPLVRRPGRQWAPAAGPGGELVYLSQDANGTRLVSHPTGDVLARGLDQEVGRPSLSVSVDQGVVVPSAGRLWRVGEQGQLTEIPFNATLTMEPSSYVVRKPEIEIDNPRWARGIVAPRIDPAGSAVAFGAMGEVWIIPLDAVGDQPAEPRPAVAMAGIQTTPAWSPDGTRLVYVSNRGGDFDLWVVNLDDGEQRQLTDLPGDEREPAWDPTGRRIAFSYFDNRTVNLYTIPSEGGAPQPLTAHEVWHWDISPTWSPDGERIAFLYRSSADDLPAAAISSVIDGVAEPTVLQLADVPITALAWSPRGELVFRAGGTLHAVEVDAEGGVRGTPRDLNSARAFHPSVDSSGDRLLYLSTDGLRLREGLDGREVSLPVRLEVQPRAKASSLTIRNVRLIDGTGAQPRGPVDILIEEGRIADIVSSEGVPASARRSDVHNDSASNSLAVEVIDGTGLTALPGLIDMHSHMFHYGLRAYLGTGVTTVRDVGFESHMIAARSEGVLSARLRGPRIVYAGEFLDGVGGPWMGNFVAWVANPDQARREVARLADFGASWIKTYVGMSPQIRRAAVEAAHAHGLPATQHEIYPALAFGADGKEHISSGWRADLRGVLAASEAVVVPTIDTGSGSFTYMREHPEIWEEPAVRNLIPSYVRADFQTAVDGADAARAAAMRQAYDDRLDMLETLWHEGVRLTVGTDPTNPYVLFGIGVHWELEHFVEAGIPPLDAIHMATGAAASALHLEEDIGTLVPGRLADLILVEGDPSQDIRATRRIRWVVFDGEPLEPSELYLGRLAQEGTGERPGRQ